MKTPRRVLAANGKRAYLPRFIAKLKNDRLLVVDYTGGHLVSNALEKPAVGQLRQEVGGGNCIYVFAEKERDGMNVKAKIEQAIAQ